MNKNQISIVLRDLDTAFVLTMQKLVYEEKLEKFWDVAVGNVLEAQPVDFIISPGNEIGRMDGGIDGAYTRKFGIKLPIRLMHEISISCVGGIQPVGTARAILTHHPDAPVFVCAPTMPWPPCQVRDTDNAYLAFKAGLHAVSALATKMLYPQVLTSGFCTLTGNMGVTNAASQMMRAYKEVCL